MAIFRLIHISDIHLTPFVAPSLLELCNKRITGWLNWKLNRGQAMDAQVLAHLVADMKRHPHDHLVVSGDLVNLSLSQEFSQARQWLEQLGNPHDISLVFGNHDAYVPGALKRACQIFAPWITSDKNHEATDTPFPYCRIRDQIAIIGVNSAQATRLLSARGYFKPPQAARLAEILAATREYFRVVVIHHPPVHGAVARHKILHGIDLFQQTIAAKGAELILHGHSHLPTLHFIKGENTQIPVVGAASASQSLEQFPKTASHFSETALDARKPPANINIFDIECKDGIWHCRLVRRTLMNKHGHFAETESCNLFP